MLGHVDKDKCCGQLSGCVMVIAVPCSESRLLVARGAELVSARSGSESQWVATVSSAEGLGAGIR